MVCRHLRVQPFKKAQQKARSHVRRPAQSRWQCHSATCGKTPPRDGLSDANSCLPMSWLIPRLSSTHRDVEKDLQGPVWNSIPGCRPLTRQSANNQQHFFLMLLLLLGEKKAQQFSLLCFEWPHHLTMNQHMAFLFHLTPVRGSHWMSLAGPPAAERQQVELTCTSQELMSDKIATYWYD